MLNFCDKLILAPMVKGSKVPLRLLALRCGADLVYTDEQIDVSFLTCKRKVNGMSEFKGFESKPCDFGRKF